MTFTEILNQEQQDELSKKDLKAYQEWAAKQIESKPAEAKIKITKKVHSNAERIIIPKAGVYVMEGVTIEENESRPNAKTGKVVVVFKVLGFCNGKAFQFVTVDSELIEAIQTHSLVNDTDTIRVQFVPIEGSRYFDYKLV